MPKVLLKFKQKKSFLFTVLLLFFITSFYAQSQFHITYNDKINLGNVNKNTRFYITSESDHIRLKGNEINNYHFSKPGIYTVKVEEKKTNHKESCTDLHLPATFQVAVSNIKMAFDEKSIEFSSPILKNKSTEGIVLRIAVSIESFDHLPVVLNRTLVHSAGIGTNIVATLDTNFKELPEGNHILQYNLNGVATENAYLMFDFIDANGKIQTVPLLTPIKN
jgi:hypothetical protein